MRALLDRYVLDNPLVVRELIERLGGGRLALGILIATLLQAAAAATAFLVFVYEQPPGIENSLSLMVYVAWTAALLTFVAFSAPLRGLGLFDWERRRQSLDQHVTSGSSPLATLRGKLIIGSLYALEILLASLPLGLLPVFLGEFSIWWMFEQMIIAGAFGFMLTCLVLWGSVIEPELGVAFAVGCVGVIALILGGPMPELMPELSVLMPTHGAWVRIASVVDGNEFERIEPHLFGHAIPGGGLLTAGLYIVVGLLGYLAAVAGPRPLFGAQAATFGTLISDGKRSWRRWVGTMMSRRRSDLRFLYENRPLWLREREGDLRDLQTTLVSLFILVLVMGLVWPPLWRWGVGEQASLMVTIVCIFIVMVAGRGAASRNELAEPGKHARTTAAYACTAFLLLAPVAIFELGLFLQPAGAVGRSAMQQDLWKVVPLITLHGLVLFLLGRGASWHAGGRMRGWSFQTLAALALHGGGPVAFMVGASVGVWGGEMAWLARLSCFYAIGSTLWGEGEISYRMPLTEGGSERVTIPLDLGEVYLYAGALAAALLLLNVLSAWNVARRRRRVAAKAKASTTLVACAALFLVAGGACAQEGEPEVEERDPTVPDIELEIGFDNVYFEVSRMPVTVRLVGGTASFQGSLELSNPDGERYWSSGSIDLEPGEVRVFRMVFSPRESSGAVLAELYRDGSAERVWMAEGAAALYHRGRALLLADAARASRSQTMSQMGDQTLVAVSPYLLPEELRGYAGVTTVVLGRLTPEGLEPEQIDALREFVLTGGALVLASGSRIGPRVTPIVDELFQPLADPQQSGERSPSFMRLTEEGDRLVELTRLTRFVELGGRLVLGSAEQPEAVSFGRGRGHVVVLAFDPWASPVTGSLACEIVLSTLEAPQSTVPLRGVSGRLESLRSTEGGVLLVLSIVCVVPLLCAILPYLIARLRKQPLRAWVYAPAGAMAAILAVGLLATRSGDTLAAADTMTWWPEDEGGQAARFVEVAVASRGRQQVALELRESWRELEVLGRRDRWDLRSEGRLVGIPDEASGATDVRGLQVGRWQSKGMRGVRAVEEPAPFLATLHVSSDRSGTTSMRLELDGLEQDLFDVVVSSPVVTGGIATEISAHTTVRKGVEPNHYNGLRPTRREGVSSADWGVTRNLYERFGGGSGGGNDDRTVSSRLFARVARSEEGWLGRSEGMRVVNGVDLVSVPLRIVVAPGSSNWLQQDAIGKRFLGSWEVSSEEEVAKTKKHRTHLFCEVALPRPENPGDFEIERVRFQPVAPGIMRRGGIQGTSQGTQAFDWKSGEWVELLGEDGASKDWSGDDLARFLHPAEQVIMLRIAWITDSGGRVGLGGQIYGLEPVEELTIRGR